MTAVLRRSLRFRAQEWLALRVRWVQFPPPRVIQVHEPVPFFKEQMPWWMRLALFAIGLALVIFASIALFLLGGLLWAIVST